jgi:transposase-like protein
MKKQRIASSKNGCGPMARCPHCGGFERLSKMRGKSTRIGLYKCYECRRPFRVTVGSFFDFSHVPLHVWLRAIYLGCSNTKGFSANHLRLILGVTPNTAGFMVQRIRKALRSDKLVQSGNDGGILDDETFIDRAGRPTAAVLSLGVPRTRLVVTVLYVRATKTVASSAPFQSRFAPARREPAADLCVILPSTCNPGGFAVTPPRRTACPGPPC